MAGAGRDITVRYQPSEALNAPPALQVSLPGAVNGTALFGSPVASGSALVWSHTLQPTEPAGTWTFAISNVADAALNAGAGSSGQVTVDQVGPTLLASSVTPTLVQAATPVTVTFTMSEAPAVTYPRLSVGGTTVPVTPTGTPNQFTATLASLGGPDGSKAVEVTLADSAGNTGFASLTPVTLDSSLAAAPCRSPPASPAPAPPSASSTWLPRPSPQPLPCK